MKTVKVKAVKREKKQIFINTDYIKLDSALKLCDIVQTGGYAKILIQDGEITVNGEVCTQRGKKITDGDVITYAHCDYVICKNENGKS